MMEVDVQVRDRNPSYGGNGCGERALVCALLEDAIGCLAGRAGSPHERRQLEADARRWIENDDRQWPFSFENVCDTLGFDAPSLRARLLGMGATNDTSCAPADPVARAASASLPAEHEVARMIREGAPLRRVAERFGISISKASVLSCGLASRIKAERDAQILALRAEGWTYRALSAHFGLSRIRVMRICTRVARAAA